MDWFKKPKAFPYLAVIAASIIMFTMLTTSDSASQSFPLILFISAKLSLIFGVIEIGLSCSGKYSGSEEVYNSINRAISAFGMSMCFILLVAAYETAQGRAGL